MKISDFKIGCYFYTGAGKWKCTDIGTRTIIAIRVDNLDNPLDYMSGPPYSAAEIAFDEYDIDGCSFVDLREQDG